MKYAFPNPSHETPFIPDNTKCTWAIPDIHFRNNETSMTFYLGKIQIQRNNSADRKCKQLIHTCQEQHHSPATQHPHCMSYWKSGIEKSKDTD